MAGAGTSELKVRASFRRAEFTLIRAIAAVVFGITLPSRGDATVVGASKLISAASNIWTAHLVAIITTIVFGVTMECHRYAATGFALELVCVARWFCAILHFIAVVQAVVFSVAYPGLWNTSGNRSVKN